MKPSALKGTVPTAPSATPKPAAAVRSAGSVAVVVLADLQRRSRLWAWSRLVLGRWPLRAVPGLRFAKVLGSGQGGGFGLKPSGTHRALFLGFDDEAAAMAFVEQSEVLAGYRSRAREMLVAVLRATSSKGSWAGSAMACTAPAPQIGPIVALTRASIQARHAPAFWRMSPAAEASLVAAPGCLLAAGLGEAPLLRQATFSLWTDAAAMDRYARSGAHQQAIRAAYAGGFFSESMFVRFVPLLLRGTWQGQHHG